MRTRSAALLPLLRSEVQGEVLALLLLHPDESYTVTSVANTVHRPMQSIQKEISRLVDAGILDDRKVGNMRYVQANTAGALYAPLAELMALTWPRAGTTRPSGRNAPGPGGLHLRVLGGAENR